MQRKPRSRCVIPAAQSRAVRRGAPGESILGDVRWLGSRIAQGGCAIVLLAAFTWAAWAEEGAASIDIVHFDRTDMP